MKKIFRKLFICFYAALALFIVVTLDDVVNTGGWALLAYLASCVMITAVSLRLSGELREGVSVPLKKLKEAIRSVSDDDLDCILDYDRQGEAGEVCEEFEKLRMKLKKDKEAREQFDRDSKELISNISHDLKTPITAIRGHVEGILDGVASSPEMFDRYMKNIYNKTNDMDRLIDELTYYSRIDTNRIPYEFRCISPVDFFSDCEDEVGNDLETKGVIFRYSCSVDPSVRVIADPEQIRRVVNNIISNSMKYMDKKPACVFLRVLDEGDFIRVEIEDNGRGIAQEDIQYIFDRFYRTDVSRNSSKGGSGIGLSIARKIIADHGGRIWAASREKKGTTIIFVLRKHQEKL